MQVTKLWHWILEEGCELHVKPVVHSKLRQQALGHPMHQCGTKPHELMATGLTLTQQAQQALL